MGQGTKTYLSRLKDLFKTSHAILGRDGAPGIIYEVGTVPPAKTWAQICLNQPVRKPGDLKIPFKVVLLPGLPPALQQEEIYTEIPAGLFHRRLMETHFPSDRFIRHFCFMLPRRHELWEGLLSDSCCICPQQELIFSQAWSKRLPQSYLKAFHRSHSRPGGWDLTGQALPALEMLKLRLPAQGLPQPYISITIAPL